VNRQEKRMAHTSNASLQVRAFVDCGVAPDTVEVASAGVSTYDLFAASAERHGDRLAVVDARRRWTYAELVRRIDEIAAAITGRRLPAASRVGLVLDRTADAVAAVLAVWKCGMTYVPIDLAMPAPRANVLIRNSAVRLIVTDGATDAEWLDSAGTLDLRSVEPLAAAAHDPEERRARGENELAYVIYTSGTTGEPKGAMIEHRSVINLGRAHGERIYRHLEHEGRGLRASFGASLSFDGAVERILLLLSGHSLFILGHEERTDPKKYIAYASEHELELLDLTPAFLKLLMRYGLLTQEHWTPRLALVGGEAIPGPLWTELSAASIPFYNVYGPTETTVNASVGRITGDTPHLGLALANTRIYVLNEAGERVRAGQEGEIQVAGVGVGRGYDNMPELSEAKFKENPFAEGNLLYARMYATGDRGRFRANGTLEFLGRTDDQIKLRGFRIEPKEITTLLCELPEVDDALLRIRTNRDADDQRLVAYVMSTTTPSRELSERLRSFLRERLPGYMVPGSVVVVDRFPLTTTGKLDDDALSALDETQGAASDRSDGPPEGITPEVAAIWEDALGTRNIDPASSFFELGGHSLSAVAMIGRVNETFDVSLPITTLITAPTLVLFDAALRAALSDQA
jgi:amino acid adenylation domain-containing protein